MALRESTTLFLPERYAYDETVLDRIEDITLLVGGRTQSEASGSWHSPANRKVVRERLLLVTWWHGASDTKGVESAMAGLVHILIDRGEESIAVETRRVHLGNNVLHQITKLHFFAEGDAVIFQ